MIRRIAFWPSQLPCRNEKSHFSCHLQLAPCYFTASLGECYIVFTPAQGHAVQVFSPLIVLMLTPSSTFLYFLPPSPPSFSLPFFPSSQWLASSWQAFVLRHADIEMLIQHQYNWNDIDWVTAAKYDCAYVRFGVSTAKFTLMEALTGSDANGVFLGSRCHSPGWTTTGPSLDHHPFSVCEMHANMFGHKFKTEKKKSSFSLFWCFIDLVLNCCCWVGHIRASGCDL